LIQVKKTRNQEELSMNNGNNQARTRQRYPEEQKVRKVFKLLGKLVPELRENRKGRHEIISGLEHADFYTRRQLFTIWNIYQVVLGEITATALQASIHYLQNHDEEEVMDHWASNLELTVNNIYRIITQSSLDSFLERFRMCYRRSIHGTS
jgi:hypothetical protein